MGRGGGVIFGQFLMTLWNIWPVVNDLMEGNNGFLPLVSGASCLYLHKCVPAAQWTAVCCSLSTQVTLHSSERRTRMDSTFPAMAHTCRGVRCRLSCGRVQQWWPRVGLPMRDSENCALWLFLRASWNYCKHCMHLLITMYVRLFCQRYTTKLICQHYTGEHKSFALTAICVAMHYNCYMLPF